MSSADAKGRAVPLRSLEWPQYFLWLALPSLTVKASIFRTPAVFRCAQMSSSSWEKSSPQLTTPVVNLGSRNTLTRELPLVPQNVQFSMEKEWWYISANELQSPKKSCICLSISKYIIWASHQKSKRVPEKHLFLLYWLCQSLWLCGSQ